MTIMDNQKIKRFSVGEKTFLSSPVPIVLTNCNPDMAAACFLSAFIFTTAFYTLVFLSNILCIWLYMNYKLI